MGNLEGGDHDRRSPDRELDLVTIAANPASCTCGGGDGDPYCCILAGGRERGDHDRRSPNGELGLPSLSSGGVLNLGVLNLAWRRGGGETDLRSLNRELDPVTAGTSSGEAPHVWRCCCTCGGPTI